MSDRAWSDFHSLPVEAQREAADFIAFLRQKYERPPVSKHLRDLEDEPFVGMWRGREDLADSSAWVRETRRREWEPGG